MTTRPLDCGITRIVQRSTWFRKPRRGPIARRGAIVVWVAVLVVVLIGFVGVALDAGVVLLAGSHLQIAADAGSLAGARLAKVQDSNVPRTAAYDIAFENKAMLFATKAPGPIRLEKNPGNAPDGDIVLGHYYRFADPFANPPRCLTPPCFITDEKPNAVKVRARRTSTSMDNHVPLLFGAVPLFNVQGIDVTRSATAVVAGSTAAGLLVLCDFCECALDFTGSTDLVLESAPGWDGDSAIQVNSDHGCAVCAGGNVMVEAPEMNIVGKDLGYCFNGGPTIDTYINPDSPPMADPLADLPPPPIGADRGRIRRGGSYAPGYYSGGLDINGNDVVTLLPGNYIFGADRGRGGLQVNGNAGLIANNVFLYIKEGPVQLNGGGTITITPSDDEGDTYWGVSIFQARDNYSQATITGNGRMNLDGTYYFPRAGYPDDVGVDIGGTGFSFGIQVIAWKLSMNGSGTIGLEYDGRFRCESDCTKVFLVQ